MPPLNRSATWDQNRSFAAGSSDKQFEVLWKLSAKPRRIATAIADITKFGRRAVVQSDHFALEDRPRRQNHLPENQKRKLRLRRTDLTKIIILNKKRP
jgi:hypothetical protein